MKTEELIESLAGDFRPVRRLPGPASTALMLTVFSLLLAVAGAALMGWRADLAPRLSDPRFWLVTALLLLVCATGETVLAILAVPGRRGSLLGTRVGVVLLVAAAGVLLSRAPWIGISPGLRWLGLGLFCTGRAVLVGVVPIAGGLWYLRRGASVHPGRSGAMLGLVGGLLGAFALQWSCDLVEAAHVLIWHILVPGMLLGLIGAWLGRHWLRW